MKNLIFVSINGLRRDCVTEEKMNNLYSFSKNGITFSNAVSSHPIEEAFYASLLTGKFFTSTGAFKNNLRIYPDHDTFSKALTDNGYSTAFIGRWPLYGTKLFVPLGRFRMGFDDIFVSFENSKNKVFYCSDTPHRQPVSESEYKAEIKIFAESVSRFEKNNSPYAVFLNLHLPVSKKTGYDDAVKLLDSELSDVLSVRDNTLIVITSSYGALTSKEEKPYSEVSVNVPFIVGGDGIISSENSILFNTCDIMPSVMKFLDIPSPVSISGIAYDLLSDSHSADSVPLFGTGPSDIFKDGREWRGLRTKQYTYVITKKSGKEYLFDNLEDPRHEQNLADDKNFEDLKNSLKHTLYKKMMEISDTFANNNYYKKYWLMDGKIKPVLK